MKFGLEGSSKAVEAVIDALRGVSDVLWVSKPHPGWDGKIMRRYVELPSSCGRLTGGLERIADCLPLAYEIGYSPLRKFGVRALARVRLGSEVVGDASPEASSRRL